MEQKVFLSVEQLVKQQQQQVAEEVVVLPDDPIVFHHLVHVDELYQPDQNLVNLLLNKENIILFDLYFIFVFD